MESNLVRYVTEHVNSGCVDKTNCLGICKMPKGYALMLNADYSHYYWLRHDGQESVIHWDKWAVYRGAKEDKLAFQSLNSNSASDRYGLDQLEVYSRVNNRWNYGSKKHPKKT